MEVNKISSNNLPTERVNSQKCEKNAATDKSDETS